MTTIRTGDILRSPSGTYVEVREPVTKDPRWRCPGWRVERLNNGTGDGYGFTEFLADHIAGNWRVVEVGGDWKLAPMTGGELEERHISRNGVIFRELRRVGSPE